MKKGFYVLMFVAVAAMGTPLRAQLIIDNWGMTTGVDTALWENLEGKDSTLIEPGPWLTRNSNLVDIGFPVSFGAGSYTQLSVNVNGTLRLGGTRINGTGNYSQPLGSDAGNGPKVEPFGARGRFDTTCYTRMARTIIGGRQAVVVETRLADYYNPTLHLSFQVHLFADGVRIVYGAADGGSLSSTTQNGLVAATGSNRDVVFIDFATHSAVRWDGGSSPTQRNSVWPAAGRWYHLAYDSTMCPYPPSVSTTGNDPSNIILTNSNGGVEDLRVRIPAVGVDTLWPASVSYLHLGGGFNPFSTYSGTVQGVCDSGRVSLRTRDFSFSTGCGAVEHLPWSTGFDSQQQASCWNTSHYSSIQSSTAWNRSGGAMRCGQTYTVYGYDSWLLSPMATLPDADGITLEFDYKAEELLGGVAPTVEVRVAACDSAGTVNTADWTTLMVLDSPYAGYTRFRLSLDAWRGQQVKVNFARTGDGGKYAYVDNFALKQYLEPDIELVAPACAYVGDTFTAVCHLLTGVPTGESHAWTSTVFGALPAADTLRLLYTEEGTDTLTVVHTNSYGSDTATVVVNVVDCRPVAAYPWKETFERGIDCWQQEGDGAAWTQDAAAGVGGSACARVQSAYGALGSQLFVSQPVQIPSDAYMLRLQWQMKRSSGNKVRRVAVLAAAADAADWTAADTLYYYEGSEMPTSYSLYEAALDSLAGREVRLAFSVAAGTSYCDTYLDDVVVRYRREPVVAVGAPAHASVGGTTRYDASLVEGDTVGLTYSWRSSLVDSTSVQPYGAAAAFEVLYPMSGTDTVTLTAANAYGSVSDTVVLTVCPVIDTFPWVGPIESEADVECWDLAGYEYYDFPMWYEDEDTDTLVSSESYLRAGGGVAYLVLPPMAIPADAHNLAVEFDLFWPSQMHLLVNTTGSTDTADFDEIAYWGSVSGAVRRKAFLDAYAGQTVRLALVSVGGVRVYVHRVAVDYDTLPKLHALEIPSKAITDSVTLCTASLRYGSRDSLRYEWHSAMVDAGLATLVADGDTLRLVYATGGTDTIRVVALNAYGTDTLVRTLRVQDCTPALTLPWRDEFSDGLECWYAPQGGNWSIFSISYPQVRYLSSFIGNDTLDSWIVSKAVLIPEDTALMPTLFWDAGSSGAVFQHGYEVLVGPDSSYADLSAYESVYVCDTVLPIINGYSNSGWRHCGVGLSRWAGEMVRVAFRNRPGGWTSTSDKVLIDNVEIRSSAAPVIALAGPASILNDEEALFEATLLEGNTEGLTLAWHSTLTDSTALQPYDSTSLQWRFRYEGPGVDTVTLVASNPYGSDTAQVIVDVEFVYQPDVVLYAPAVCFVGDTAEFFGKLNDCYAVNLNYEWHSTMVVAGQAMQLVRDNRIYILYSAEGMDTVRVVASTLYGTDTAWTVRAVGSHPLPTVSTMEGPDVVFAPDSATFSAALNDCSRNGLAVSWRSSLTGEGVVSAAQPLGHSSMGCHYTAGGMDTVVFIVSNDYGADTLVRLVRVVDCSGVAVPYVEDFGAISPTAYDTAGSLPDCWTTVWNGNSRYAAHVIDHYRYMSNLADTVLFMVAGSGVGNGTSCVVLPRFDDDIHFLSLALSHRFEAASIGSLKAGYVDADGLFVPLRSLAGRNYFWRDTVSYGIDSIPADARMALQWQQTSSYYGVALDDIHVFRDSTLYAPAGVVVSDVSFNCVSLEWDAVRLAEHYLVQIDGVADTVVDDLSVTLCGLATNTSYTARVAALGDGDTGRFALATFRTECRLMDLPAYYSFDSTRSNNLPACWGCAPYNTAYVGYPSYSYHNGVVSLYDVAQSAFVYTPIVEAAADSLMVSFEVFAEDTVGAFEAGVMDPADTTTFTPLFFGNATNVRVRHQFDTRTVGDGRVAIAFRNASPGHFLYIDNLTIAPIPACPYPYDICVSSNDPRSAEIVWRTGLSLGSAGQYNLLLVDRADSVTMETTENQYWTSDTMLTLYGLEPGHIYDALLKSICDGDTAVSDTFVVAPSASYCMEEVRREDDGTGDYERSNSHIPFSYRAYNYSQTLYAATLGLPLDTLFGIAYHVVSSNGQGSDHLLDVYIGQTTADTFTVPIPASQLTLAVENFRFPVKDTGWVHINFTTPVPLDGVGNLIVTIDDNTGIFEPGADFSFSTHVKHMGGILHHWDHNHDLDPDSLNFNTGMMNRIVPDIRLLGECSTERCLPPMVQAEVDTHSVGLHWEIRGSEDRWVVEYKVEGVTPWMVADSTDIDTYTLAPLHAGTRYGVRVGSLCSGGDTLWSDSLSVRTLCGTLTVPHYESFQVLMAEASQSTEMMPCWQLGGNSMMSNGGGLWMSREDALVISPEIDASLDTLQLRLRARGTTFRACNLYVGACDADGSNLQWVDTLLTTDSVEQYVVYFNRYQGASRHVVFSVGQWAPTLLDVSIEPIDRCVPVHEMTVSRLMPTSALVSWKPQSGQGLWAVYLDGNLLGTTTDSSYVLGGMSPSTEHTVGVRAVCGPGDTSAATLRTFATLCPPEELPYVENFGAYEERIEPQCWYVELGSEYSHALVSPSATDAALDFYDYSSEYMNPDSALNYACTPMLRVAGHPVTVRFRLHVDNRYDFGGSFEVGLMSDPSDTATFVRLGETITTYDTVSSGLTYEFVLDTLADSVVCVALRWRGQMSAHLHEILVTPRFTAQVLSADTAMGTVEGGGEYEYGGVAPLVATPKEGYRFVRWSDGDLYATRSLVVTSDTTVTAYFAPQLPQDIDDLQLQASGLVVYPNPASSRVRVESDGMKVESVAVLDLNGRVVQDNRGLAGRSSVTLDVSTLPGGVYYLRIGTSAGTVVRKLVVQ